MVRRNSIEASTRSSMAKSELIRGSELGVDPIAAKVKMLDGGLRNLSAAQPDFLLKVNSMEARLDTKIDSLAETMNAMLRTLSQLSNQLGIRPIEADTSRQTSPVTFSDAYVRDDHNRLPLDNRKSLLRTIELPKFDGSNAYDWLSKVERIFRVSRYSDSDKLDLVALSLEGDVLKWFNWQLIRREFRSWEDFRRRLFRKFGAAPAESPGNRLFAIKQTGTVSASVTELEELSAQVIEQQTVYKEDSITQLQVPVSKLEHSLQIHIESPNACEHVVGCAELGTDTDVSAYVTKSEELSSQVIGLDESHLEHLFAPGLQTEMKEVLKLKEPLGVENNPAVLRRETGSFCQLSSEETSKPWGNQQTFTSTPIASVHFLSFEVGTEETMFSGLSQTSQVWEPGGVLASVHVADSLGEKASYTEKKLILQYQEMDSTNGTGADVESANGANGANGGGDIDALPPPPPILPPNGEPLHVKTEPVEKKNWRVPMARKGFGTKGQKIPLLTNHFKVDVADLQGHFYHYSVALANVMRGQESENCDDVGGNILGCRGLGQLSLDNLRSHVWHKWKSKPVTECKTSDVIFQLVLERSVSHDCLLGSRGEKKNVSWLEVICVLAECMMRKSSAIWHRWRRKASICVLPLQFSFFKLEDKLVLRGESIDTIGDVAS